MAALPSRRNPIDSTLPAGPLEPMKDLDGLLVVALEQAVAAPYASGRLAQAGARVIKIERPEGDFARGYDRLVHGQSAYFVWLNHGKESLCLNLKDTGDARLLHRIIARADVFIQNLAPGVATRLGFDQIGLRRADPRLITCAISGYGEDGPYADQKAYDLLIQAETGLAAITGTPDGPARVGVSVSDIAAGMTAHAAILQALYARERTGAGRHIALSLFQATADWMNVPYLQHHYGGKTPGRHGVRHPSIAPYGAFTCADGKALLISIQNEREWRALCREILGDESIADRPGMEDNSARVANRAEVDGLFAEAFGRHDREANIARLAKARIAYGRLSDLDDLTRHPQRALMRVETSDGPVELLAPADVINGAPRSGGTVPDRGAHTTALRAEFGTG